MYEMQDFMNVFDKYYTNNILLGRYQASVIALQIFRLRRSCNFLIFGCGNDSILWAELNKYGNTVFLESSDNWKNKVLSAHPQLNIEIYDVGENTVADSLADNIQYLPQPEIMRKFKYDLIFIDGPTGYNNSCPGRALPIIWTKEIVCAHTNVFIDDYERPIEYKYFNSYFLKSVVISESQRGKNGVMAWYDPYLQTLLSNFVCRTN